MSDMDNITGMEHMGNTEHDTGQHIEGLPGPGSYDGGNFAEEGGMPDETQPSEEGADKPKRRRKKADEPTPGVLDGIHSGDGDEQDDSYADGEGAVMDEADGLPSEGADEVAGAPRRRERGLDGQGRVIYERGNRGQHELSLLTGARNARRILTATIDGIDTDGQAQPRVVFYIGTVKVLIPFSEMGMDLNPKEIEPGEAARIIDTMLGAKIDYMVRGVDATNRIAGASRKAAMLLRRQTILNARQGDSYRIQKGAIVTARVLQVYRSSMLVEVYGYQTYIRRSAASSLWVTDVREFADVGDEKHVEVVELERDSKGEVTHMAVSIRGADDIPYTELRTGNTYTGKITGFSDTAYFVRVAGIPMDVRCPIVSNHVIDMMYTGDYVKFVVRGVYDDRPTGSIRKIIKKGAADNW